MPEAPPKISVAIITLNEEAEIAACLESVAWADEVVVLDSQSTDRTVEIARRHTPHVYIEPWSGQGRHKARAVELTTNEWVFLLDADERCTPELATEMRAAAARNDCGAFRIRRKNIYRGQWVKHGGWWPDYVTRLFRKDQARVNNARIHDAVVADGKRSSLKAVILHYSYADVADVLERVSRYARETAKEKIAAGDRGSWLKAFLHSVGAFVRMYIFRAGFLDGGAGLLFAYAQAATAFFRYAIVAEQKTKAEG